MPCGMEILKVKTKVEMLSIGLAAERQYFCKLNEKYIDTILERY